MKKFIIITLLCFTSYSFISAQADATQEIATSEVSQNSVTPTPLEASAPSDISGSPALPAKDNSWLSSFFAIATESDSLIVRLLVILLIGLLMSLTPCIYPMIPITAGILQAQGSKSFLTNFLLALSYTVGIATTFATLGLMAAFAGQAMGSLMSKPAFILPLVALLIYLALSMIGLYEMYVPKLLQPQSRAVTGGSFVSAFLFGMVSGIVASPCLSPGLVCLLCIVTAIGNKFLGFLMLFVFGIGLSIPLLVIGTFSGSLNVLPRAGMWMVEIKKLFGYMMLAMCLYFLSYITPANWMMVIITAFVMILGIIFFTYAKHAHSKIWKKIYYILALVLIAASGFLAFKTYQAFANTQVASHNWQTDYTSAKQQAMDQNKKLFVDIGAPFCSICKAIDATLLSNKQVEDALNKVAVIVKVDGADSKNSELIKQYQVFGFPTILLIDPASQEVIKKWGPELYGSSPEKFIEEL